MKRPWFLALASLLVMQLSAQTPARIDSLHADTLHSQVQFSTSDAWNYVDRVVNTNSFWRSQQDPLRKSLQRLLDHSEEHFDSTRTRLLQENLSLIDVQVGDSIVADSNALKWLNDSTFLVDAHGWSPDLYLEEELRLIYPGGIRQDLFVITTDSSTISDSIAQIPDTLHITLIDTAAIEALGIVMHSIRDNRITPPLEKDGLIGRISADGTRVDYFIPGTTWEASEESPFHIVESEYHLDSLQYALNTLLDYTSERDSTLLWINDIYGKSSPYWLSAGDEDASRFWVKNYNNDSITIWIGNPGPNEISLMLEDDIRINRLMKEDIHYLPEFVEMPDRSLVPVARLEPDPIYWDYNLESALTLNQSYLSNWTKGGESSFSTMIDLLGEATYNNSTANTKWFNSMRINFGTLSTKENGFRKNNDLFELNSKFNRNASGKIGMSASLYMKNQLAKGYNYPNDSVVVSKFLNPGSLTVGLGVEYKPFKNTSINLAPLSYKNTFVLDTAQIDQTKHGIEAGKRAKQEMGTQIVLNNKFSPYKDLSIQNRLRLFSSYLNKPQNVDVDWELIMDQKINWFFTIRLNLHLIYDDDVRFPVLDSEDNPVILPDGSEKTVAKTQFKEFIGLSLQFKF